MEFLCPLCNGLIEYNVQCPSCGGGMVDEGPIVDYLDEYSPYLSNNITQLVDGGAYDKCVHLFQCKECTRDKRIEIDRVRM